MFMHFQLMLQNHSFPVILRVDVDVTFRFPGVSYESGLSVL